MLTEITDRPGSDTPTGLAWVLVEIDSGGAPEAMLLLPGVRFPVAICEKRAAEAS